MFDSNYILTRLQNGEKADSIAQEMADALNGAIAEQTKRKFDDVQKSLHEDCDIIAEAMGDFLQKVCPEMVTDETIDGNTVYEIMNDVVELFRSMRELSRQLPVTQKNTKKDMPIDDIIADFLNKNIH